MRAVLAAVVLVGVAGLAVLAAPDMFIGGEIVPFHYAAGTYAVPFLALGGYWPITNTIGIATTLSTDAPAILSGWYGAALEGRVLLSEAAWFGIGTEWWLEFTDFEFSDYAWSIFAKLGATWGNSILTYVSFNLPQRIDPDDPFLGAWLTLGFGYNFPVLVESSAPAGP